MSAETLVRVRDLRKVYSLAHFRAAEAIANTGRVLTLRRPKRSKGFRGEVVAVDGISFDVQRGEVVGVVGSNGAGKSTTLRMLAGVASPTSGTVETAGRVTAILDIAAGLVLDRPGRENVGYVARLYGMSSDEIGAKTDEIIAFAGLEPFADFPVRTYSTGMRARLAFSIVTAVDPDILLIDEALSVGDIGFALKSRARIRALCAQGSAVILVSHNLPSIRELCDRVIWLHKGRIEADGEPGEVTERYRAVAHEQAQVEIERRFADRARTLIHGDDARIERVRCVGDDGVERFLFEVSDRFGIELDVLATRTLAGIRVRVELLRFDGVLVVAQESPSLDLPQGASTVRADFGELRLGRFTYQVRLELRRADGQPLASAQRVMAVHDELRAYNATYYASVDWRSGIRASSERSVGGR